MSYHHVRAFLGPKHITNKTPTIPFKKRIGNEHIGFSQVQRGALVCLSSLQGATELTSCQYVLCIYNYYFFPFCRVTKSCGFKNAQNKRKQVKNSRQLSANPNLYKTSIYH